MKITLLSQIFISIYFKKYFSYLAAQWIEPQSANQRVSGSVPSPGTCLG